MADSQALRDNVATSYHVGVDERERFQNPEWDGQSVWVATSRGQRLVALLRRRVSGSGGLLEWNGRSAAGALRMAEGELCDKRAYPMDWLDLPRIDATLDDVPGTSASLETMLAEHGRIWGSLEGSRADSRSPLLDADATPMLA